MGLQEARQPSERMILKFGVRCHRPAKVVVPVVSLVRYGWSVGAEIRTEADMFAMHGLVGDFWSLG